VPPAPTVQLDPPAGPTVNRTTTLTARVEAADPLEITGVEFLVDGTVIGEATEEPYSIEWDTSTVEDGDYAVTARATDSEERVVDSDPVTFRVLNNPVFHVEPSNAQVLPANDSEATAAGDITVDLVSGAVTGGITLEGITATMAHIHRGFAGSDGPVIVNFEQDANDPARWNAVEGAMLSVEDIDNLLDGALYVNVHSENFPAGEIRAQILPEGFAVIVSPMDNEQVVPPAPDAASGTVVATVDSNANRVTIHVRTDELVEPTEAHVHIAAAGENGSEALFALEQLEDDPNHWVAERQDVGAAQIEDLDENLWYADVHSTGAPDGALRGQILASDEPEPEPPEAATLTQLQGEIFGPICSGCHTGVGAVLPGAMDLTSAAASFDSLVNVPSLQQGELLRVAPNDPDNSYLVRKLEGGPGITGVQMPAGSAPLSQEMIDLVRSWIEAGAQEN